MKWGDISNEPVPTIGIRLEEIVFRGHDGKLNRTGKAFLEGLTRHDVSIVLFTTGDYRSGAAKSFKWGVPYTRICAVNSILELIQVCQEQSLLQYWDTDKDILSKMKERIFKDTEIRFWTLQGNLYHE